MSWDIFVQDIPESAKSIKEIPESFQPQPVGSKSEITSRILEIVPEANFSDPAWGIIEGETFSVEINLGDDEVVSSFAFHARGDENALIVISAILQHLKLRAFDSNGIFTPEKSSEDFKNWKEYREFVISSREA
ncbi:MAG: hypothetical protein CL667_09560 [Balneola sp.]|jgi:hypothetical protein|nr:hypothetical protein [Balneola sp.]HAD49929.1 hypothetical protein [Algoriphagus sp.]|tara:strand:- start:580 stop:981 length:402 start_codon:yes stop_codon:yes gene_type:complete